MPSIVVKLAWYLGIHSSRNCWSSLVFRVEDKIPANPNLAYLKPDTHIVELIMRKCLTSYIVSHLCHHVEHGAVHCFFFNILELFQGFSLFQSSISNLWHEVETKSVMKQCKEKLDQQRMNV